MRVPRELVARIDAMLADAGASPPGNRDASGGTSAGADDRVSVRVSLTKGRGPDAQALIVPPNGDRLWFSADLVAEQAGVDVSELPGMELVAVVEGGELVRFERE
jgi:hypothetical protein